MDDCYQVCHQSQVTCRKKGADNLQSLPDKPESETPHERTRGSGYATRAYSLLQP